MNYKRQFQRNKQKREGTLLMKKAVARKMGISLSALNEKLKKAEEAKK